MGSKWHYSCEAWKPGSPGETWEIGVSERKFRAIQAAGHVVKLCRLALVKEVVSDPISIVRGWDRPDTDGCFAYAGLPSRDIRSTTVQTPPPKDMEFAVFVLPDGTIDDWIW